MDAIAGPGCKAAINELIPPLGDVKSMLNEAGYIHVKILPRLTVTGPPVGWNFGFVSVAGKNSSKG